MEAVFKWPLKFCIFSSFCIFKNFLHLSSLPYFTYPDASGLKIQPRTLFNHDQDSTWGILRWNFKKYKSRKRYWFDRWIHCNFNCYRCCCTHLYPTKTAGTLWIKCRKRLKIVSFSNFEPPIKLLPDNSILANLSWNYNNQIDYYSMHVNRYGIILTKHFWRQKFEKFAKKVIRLLLITRATSPLRDC